MNIRFGLFLALDLNLSIFLYELLICPLSIVPVTKRVDILADLILDWVLFLALSLKLFIFRQLSLNLLLVIKQKNFERIIFYHNQIYMGSVSHTEI